MRSTAHTQRKLIEIGTVQDHIQSSLENTGKPCENVLWHQIIIFALQLISIFQCFNTPMLNILNN